MGNEKRIILVDENDQQIGTADKLKAHLTGARHRAFSIFLFNSNKEFLLQQRAMGKYHTPGLWTNTCCSHPYNGECLEDATARRLKEEMGIAAPLRWVCRFDYRAEFANGLIENEIDHVFVGRFDGPPRVDAGEVMAWTYKSLASIDADMALFPHRYTPWFKKLYQRAYGHA